MKPVECYALMSKHGHIITWTCFRSEGHPWLEYLRRDRWTDDVRAAVEKLKAEGYSEVRVRICGMDEKR